MQSAVLERVVGQQCHDKRRQEVRRKSTGSTTKRAKVSNRISLFYHQIIVENGRAVSAGHFGVNEWADEWR